MKCAKCGMEAKGWKCAICGAESEQHDASHTHGEPASDRNCMPMCTGCKQAEALCTCKAQE